jgi:hypothetical protein
VHKKGVVLVQLNPLDGLHSAASYNDNEINIIDPYQEYLCIKEKYRC